MPPLASTTPLYNIALPFAFVKRWILSSHRGTASRRALPGDISGKEMWLEKVMPIFAVVTRGANAGVLLLLITRQWEDPGNRALGVTLIEKKRKVWVLRRGKNGLADWFCEETGVKVVTSRPLCMLCNEVKWQHAEKVALFPQFLSGDLQKLFWSYHCCCAARIDEEAI